MKYDIERLEADLLALVKSKLPAKIAEIQAEKADSINLVVPVDADYFNTTDDEVINRKLSVQHGAVDGLPNSIGPATAEENRYVFIVYLNELNEGPGGAVRKKLFRYARAFKEILEENFDRFPQVSNMKIQTIAPQAWAENENSPVYKAGGIYIKTSLAS
jgi:hypothetical protein